VPAFQPPPLLVRWREPLEWIVLFVVAAAIIGCFLLLGPSASQPLAAAVAIWAALKTAYYFAETLRHLLEAIAKDHAYHRFLLIVAYNMAQITLSFAIDFYCLFWIDPDSLSIDNNMHGLELMFECFYFSVLNFSFFGYGDITPHHVASKFVMLLEVVTAFSTVIFLLSDFVSIKEAMRRKQK
jgi:Ion channel